MHMELATIRRYLAALEQMTNHPSPEVRGLARETIATFTECPIHEVLSPIHNSPMKELTSYERILRVLATGAPK